MEDINERKRNSGTGAGAPSCSKTKKLDMSSAQILLECERTLAQNLLEIKFEQPVEYVYNPLDYAWDIHKKFVTKFMTRNKYPVMYLGMNPGPWGMAQNGVPFGEISIVKNWFGITEGEVGAPIKEHPSKPILGLNCKRSEVSGRRFWALIQKIFSSPEEFFSHSFVYNLCPLTFMDKGGKNLTPNELSLKQRKLLLDLCRSSLAEILKEVDVEVIVAVGKFAEKEAIATLAKNFRLIKTMDKTKELEKKLDNLEAKSKGPKTAEDWMRDALVRAEEALQRGEVPVGCIFILDNEVVAVGSNEVNETKNATRHAEMTCVDQVFEMCKLQDRNYGDIFPQIDVIVTVEPCIMCASALHQLPVRSVVYGAANPRFGGCSSVLDVTTVHKNSPVQVVGGVFADEAVQLLKLFYQGTNPNAPKPKVKKRKCDQSAT